MKISGLATDWYHGSSITLIKTQLKISPLISVIRVSFFKLQHSVNCHNHPQPLLLVQYSHGIVSYAAVQRQQSSIEQLHSTAATVRQHMTQRRDYIARSVMVVVGCDNLRNVAI